MMLDHVIKDGYARAVYDDCVIWHIDSHKDCEFAVARFPFVPDYHLCDWLDDYTGGCEHPLQTFKTLTQALAVLKVIEGSQS